MLTDRGLDGITSCAVAVILRGGIASLVEQDWPSYGSITHLSKSRLATLFL